MSHSESQVLGFHLSRVGAERIREMVSLSPVTRLIGLESVLEEFERKAIQLQPEILLVEYAADHARLVEVLGRLKVTAPKSAVVAMAESSDPKDILAAMRLGVREYLTVAEGGPDRLTAEFNEAALRVRKEAQTSGHVQGEMWTVVGAKGGVGASHLALNLGWALSQNVGRRVALADLDLAGGDAAFLLDLEPKTTVLDAVRNFDRLDPILMDALLIDIAPGLRLLAAPSDPVAAEEVGEEHVERMLDRLLAGYEFLVADVPSRLDAASVVALERADRIIVVLEASLPCLKAARRLLSLCDRLGRDDGRVQVVVNRFDSRGALAKREVERVLARSVLAWLPNDYKAIVNAGNAGRPVLKDKPRSAWSKAVAKLVKRLVEARKEEVEIDGAGPVFGFGRAVGQTA